jgi:SAM-dependent methyltransferase
VTGRPAASETGLHTGIHTAARVGFDVAAEAYERGRPEYPEAAVRWLVRELGLEPGALLLDLAAGTGKLTRLLVPSGAIVIGMEPVEGMRRVFRAVLPGVPLAGGRAEALPLADASVDAAVVAQAFHWFEAAAAIRELHRVLRPGGRLGLAWNVRDEESSPFWARLTEVLAPHRGDAPTHRGYGWRRAFEESDLFTPFEIRSFSFRQELTRGEVIDRVLSTSFIGALSQRERAGVAASVVSLLESESDTEGLDVVQLPYRTDVYRYTRRD